MNSSSQHTPLISVITVCYNDRDNLEQTMQSVLAQTCDDFEYIVVDGQSNDGSKALIRRYEHGIARWVSEPDKGIYDAMNKGTQLARGQFVNYLNAGDTFTDAEVLKKVHAALRDQPQTDVLYGRAVNRTEGPNGLRYEKGAPITQDTLFTSIPFCHQAMFFRRETFLAQGGYDLRFKVIADYAWTVRYALSRPDMEGFSYLDEVVVEYLDGGFSFKNLRLAGEEKLQLAKQHLKGAYLLRNYASYASFRIKAVLIPMMNKWQLLNRYRKAKYKLLGKAIS
jgi:glycosyltransferase involved in cell wall biosynthesis